MSTTADATALAALVEQGSVSPAELVDAAISRAEEVNGDINAVIHPRYEAARAEAAAELPDGPFRGVPFLVKDLECTMAGEPHHLGCAALRDADVRATVDSYLYQRFRGSGLVTLGRTNTPEFGSTITTEPVAFGPTRNPWNLAHSAGGSSGGSAAAVAAGIVPMAHGNDGGGSIRIPASECGLVGLKPSRGRISPGPEVGEAWAGATINGVISRSVRDTAGALDVISGYEPGDLYTATPPVRPYAEEVGAPVGQLRIGLVADAPDADVHPECVVAAETAGRLLESLGHVVEPDGPPELSDPAFVEHFIRVIAASSARSNDVLGETLGRSLTADDMELDNWQMAEIGRTVSAVDYLAAVEWIHDYTRRMARWWASGYDLLITPTLAVPPPEIGWLRDPQLGGERLTSVLLFTAQFNSTGQPAVSLPLHWTADGLPVGVQLVAAYGAEGLLVRIAAQLEEAQPWSTRLPPLFAA